MVVVGLFEKSSLVEKSRKWSSLFEGIVPISGLTLVVNFSIQDGINGRDS